VGEKAHIFEAQYLHGTCGCRCGGYKWEGHAHYPGRSDDLPLATVIERWRDGDQKSAEAIVGGNRPLKGRTCGTDWEPDSR